MTDLKNFLTSTSHLKSLAAPDMCCYTTW